MPKFAPGQSGNPAGRRPRTDTEQRQREAIRKALPGIVAELISSAQSGDTTAAKLLLERVMPAYKPQDRPAPLALANGTPDLAGAAQAALVGLSSGTLTPDQAGAVAGVLSALVRVKESVELENRVAALENRTHDKTA